MSINYSTASDKSSTLRSPRERKETLRKIISKAESLQEAVNDRTIQSLESCMEETDTINSETTLEEKIHNQEEVLMDSEMMSISSKVLKQCSRSLTKLVCSYNHVEFATRVAEYVKKLPDIEPEEPDWSLLEMQVIKCFKRTPHYTTLLGTLAPLEKKEVTRRKPVVKDAQAQIKRPENVVTVEKEEKGLEQTVKMKAFISRYYKAHKEPLDFFKLVLHPSDFGKTVENILQMSFLVRDGKVKVTKDKLGILVIEPISKDSAAEKNPEDAANIQNVMRLNMEQWRILKDTYRLKKPMFNFDV